MSKVPDVIKYDPELISTDSAKFGQMWRLITKDEYDAFKRGEADTLTREKATLCRHDLESAFWAGYDHGSGAAISFDEWYANRYGDIMGERQKSPED